MAHQTHEIIFITLQNHKNLCSGIWPALFFFRFRSTIYVIKYYVVFFFKAIFSILFKIIFLLGKFVAKKNEQFSTIFTVKSFLFFVNGFVRWCVCVLYLYVCCTR